MFIIIAVATATAIVLSTVAQWAFARPLRYQCISLYGSDESDTSYFPDSPPNHAVLWVCIPGTGICNADSFGTIRDKTLLLTGDVLYIKYPEKWFSFKKSQDFLVELIKREATRRKEIRFYVASLGAKITIAAEAQLLSSDIGNCKITNYLVSPTFGLSDIKAIADFRGFLKVMGNKVVDDIDMDIGLQAQANQDAASHKLLLITQLIAAVVQVAKPIDKGIDTVIFGGEMDWLTDSNTAYRNFVENISSQVKLIWIPELQTHCEFVREANRYNIALYELLFF